MSTHVRSSIYMPFTHSYLEVWLLFFVYFPQENIAMKTADRRSSLFKILTHRTTHNITQLQQIRLRWASTLAQLYGYKILALNSKKGDVLKMLRFSLVTVAELTRFGNFEDKFSRIFSFLGQSMYFGYSKEPSRWEGSFERPKHMN